MNLPPDPNELPPPSPGDGQVDPLLEQWAKQQQQAKSGSHHPSLKVIGIAAVALLGFGVLAAAGNSEDDDNDDGGRKMTLTEAACQMLGDGEEPELVYAVMKDLAADHPLQLGEDEALAARVAMNQAQAQGC